MIERATSNDLAEIISLQRLAFRDISVRLQEPNIPPMTQTVEDLNDERSRKLILKFVQGNALLGSVRGSVVGDTCHIERLIVRPDHWNQGIGRALMHAIEDSFPAARRFELFTQADDERSMGFYRSLGYVPFRNERMSEGLTFAYMEKDASR